MNPWTPRLVTALAATLALLTLAGGFLSGTVKGSESRPTADSANASLTGVTPRDSLAPLSVLASRDHWGRYRAPQAADATEPASAPPSASSSNAVERSFELVGIEGHASRRLALLLPRAAPATVTPVGGDDIIRLRTGDTLIEGVMVMEIGVASVSFRTGDGTATLQLYRNIP